MRESRVFLYRDEGDLVKSSVFTIDEDVKCNFSPCFGRKYGNHAIFPYREEEYITVVV